MIPLPEHWQYAALGALSMTPILGVFWSVANYWRRAANAATDDQERLRRDKLEALGTASKLANQVIELTIKLDNAKAKIADLTPYREATRLAQIVAKDQNQIIADQSDRLNQIITRGKTKNPNSTVKAMVRIAEGG